MSTYNNSALTYDASTTAYDGYGNLLNLPYLIVETAFNDGPYVANPVWTDISSFVRSANISRGRNDDLNQFVGTATIQLDNRARTFDPFNTGTPRTNLIPNASFETGTTEWTTQGGATVARITTDAWTGSACAQVTSSATNYNNIITGFIPVTSNTAYTLSAYAKNVSGNTRTVYVAIQWFTAAGVYISETNSGSQGTLASGSAWTIRNCTGTAPATATQAKVVLLSGTTGLSAGWLTRWDGVLFERSSTVGSYFDGSTYGVGNISAQAITAWTGTPFTSTSTLNKYPTQAQLLPRRQIRLRAMIGSTIYPVFRGYIAGWPVSYTDAGKDSTVTIECFDALSLLSTEETPFEWYDYYIRQKNPTNYYRLDDPPGTVLTDTTGNCNATANVIFSPSLNYVYFDSGPSVVPGLTGASFKPREMVFKGSSSQPKIDDSGTACLMFWYQRNDLSDSYASFKYEGPGSTYVQVVFIRLTTTTWKLQVSVAKGGVTMVWESTASTFGDNNPHHLAIYMSRNDIVVYLDGTGITGTISFPFGGTSVNGDFAPVNYIEFFTAYYTNNACSIQSIALFAPGSVIPTTDIPIFYALGKGYLNETSSSRVARLIGTTNFPTALVSTPASPAAALSNITNENTLPSELALVSNSEGGELYVDKAGTLTMTGRNSQNTATRSVTTQAAFKDTGTDLKYGTSLTIQYDADSIRNEFTYNASNATVLVEDTTSIDTYSRNAATISTQLSTKADATTLANLRLEYFSNIIPQVSPLLVSVTRSTSDWQDLLDLELLDQITVTRTPSTGSAVEVRMLVNAIQHNITPGDWNMTVTGSARYANWFTIDTDYLDGDRLLV